VKKWHNLLSAAMDQPKPTAELRSAITELTTKPKKSFTGPATLAKACPNCSERNHVRRKLCINCQFVLRP